MPTSLDPIAGPTRASPAGDLPPSEAPLRADRLRWLSGGGSRGPASVPATGQTFAATLAEEAGAALRWSGHAHRRLEERGIAPDAETVARLARAVEVASARGARSSVIWLDRIAYVVDVPTATVVTAVATSSGKEAVFTNIDSLVIA